MSLLSYHEICELIEQGVIQNVDGYDAVNSSSLDIHLGNVLLIEDIHTPQDSSNILYLNKKSQLPVERVELKEDGVFLMHPGQFLLAQSRELFNLPAHISAEYKLKSSMARIGLEHMNAGWCDAGWHGSVLTLELKNLTERHRIALTVGDRIGQMIFFKHSAVPKDKSYAERGSYNHKTEVVGVLGVSK